MKLIKSPKFLIFLIVFVNFLGYGIVFPILPLITEEYGGDPLVSGILIAIFSLMQLIFMPVLGRLSDRWGRRPLLIFSLWGTVLSFAIMGVTHSIFWLLVARIIDGASGGNISIAQAYMADITDKKGRTGGMGIIAAGVSLGFIFGPLWGGFFSSISLSAPFLAAALLTFVSVVLSQFFLPESLSEKKITFEKKHFHFAEFIRCMGKTAMCILFFSNLLLFWGVSGFQTILSLFGKDVIKLTVAQISLFFAFGGIISAGIQGFAIGKIVDRFGEKKIFLAGAAASIIGLLFITKVSLLMVFIGMTVYSIGNSVLLPVLQALVSENSSSFDQGGNLGLLQSFGSIGRIFGPVVSGFLYENYSPFASFYMSVIIFFLIFLIGWSKLTSSKTAYNSNW